MTSANLRVFSAILLARARTHAHTHTRTHAHTHTRAHPPRPHFDPFNLNMVSRVAVLTCGRTLIYNARNIWHTDLAFNPILFDTQTFGIVTIRNEI
jgi:hypothetical protein